MHADVIVVGLGSMGSAAAYHLAARGLRVVGLDRFSPPHHRGAHSGGSRITRMAYMEGADYVPLVRRSHELWRELESTTQTSLLTTTGGLMLGRPESVPVAGALATARAHDLPHEVLDADSIRLRFPAFTPADHEVGLYEEIAGILRPEAAISAHLRAARWCDADLRCGAAVHDWQADPDGVRVIVDDEVILAAALVLTPGPWAAEMARLNLPMRVQRRVQHYWRASDPALLANARLPVWIWEYGPGQLAYGLPEVDSGGIKAALHHGTEAVDPDEGAQPARAKEIEYLRDWLAGHLPTLADGGWLRSEPCLYTLTPDEHFVLGHHPQHANVVVACGFSGHGFKFSPVVGEIIADLVSTGSTGHPIGLFDPTRFSSVGGAR